MCEPEEIIGECFGYDPEIRIVLPKTSDEMNYVNQLKEMYNKKERENNTKFIGNSRGSFNATFKIHAYQTVRSLNCEINICDTPGDCLTKLMMNRSWYKFKINETEVDIEVQLRYYLDISRVREYTFTIESK